MKQLEIEYKNAICLEVPDLWSRIEAGIDEYESSKVKEEKKVIKFDHKKVIAYAGRFSAAAVCLLLAMGAFKLVSGGDKAANMATSEAPMMSDSAATYTAADECCEPAAAEEYKTDSDMEAEQSFDSSYSMSDAASEAATESEAVNADETFDPAKRAEYTINSKDKDLVADVDMLLNPTDNLMKVLEIEYGDAQKILLLLKIEGINDPAGFAPPGEDFVDDEKISTISAIGEETIRLGFADEAGNKYIMYCNKEDTGTDVVAIIKDDQSGELIYEKSALEK